MKKIINYIKSKNKLAQIVIISPTKRANETWSSVGGGGWSYNDFDREMNEICEEYGCGFVTWRGCTLLYDANNFNADMIHPNDTTYRYMGAYIAGQISKFFMGSFSFT